MKSAILIDAREFVPGRFTGIGRVLVGLIDALEDSTVADRIVLALSTGSSLPLLLQGRRRIETTFLPVSFLQSEKRLSVLTRSANVFISPYPKLPLWGCHCPCINTIHDVLNLTHPLYRWRAQIIFDRWQLKRALRQAEVTWFDSHYSLEETIKVAGFAGNHSVIRYPGVETVFDASPNLQDQDILAGLNLESGYIIVAGNGKPHKNLGILLSCATQLRRNILFVGVSAQNRLYWRDNQAGKLTRWIDYVPDTVLPALLRQAFCLAQPSTAEGYGYPPLEAMACGTPAIVSNISVLVETTGGHALAVDPHSPDDWRQAFERLEDENIYQHQVESGLQWVASLKGRTAWAAHIKDIQSLLGSR